MKRLADSTKEQIYKNIHTYVYGDLTNEDIEKAREVIKNFTKKFSSAIYEVREACEDIKNNKTIFEKVFAPISAYTTEEDTYSFTTLLNLSFNTFTDTEVFENWTIYDLTVENELLNYFDMDIKQKLVKYEDLLKKDIDDIYDTLTDEEKELAITDFKSFMRKCI